MKKFDPETKPLFISPKFSVENWKALSFTTEDDWQKAFEILEDRIEDRFLKVIKRIEKYTYAGFAVLALDCLLIETLQQFREGVSETPWRKSQEYFEKFLTQTSFKKFFNTHLARLFFKQIRCGILHQAEIKGSSRISKHTDVLLVKPAKDQKGLIINRKMFHEQLVKEFKLYLLELRKNNPPQINLRTNFKKKMDYICRV